MNKVIGAILGIIILIGGAYFVFTAKPSDTGPITFGFITPLSGDAAPLGEPVRDAVMLAEKEINEAGGINGRQLRVIYEDGHCDGQGGASAAQKLIDIDKVRFIIGGGCSGETLGAAPIAEKAHVILFSPSSGSADITNAGDYIFRNFPSDATSGRKIAEVATDQNFTKVALLAEKTDYAQALRRVFLQRFTELGGEVVIDESFESDDRDMRTQLSKIKATSPSAIYIIPQTPATLEIVLRQMQELGLKTQILSNEHINNEAILGKIPRTIEGALYAEPAFDETAPSTIAFLEKYKTTYGSLGGIPSMYLATAYDAVYLLKEMIEQNGEDTERVKKALYKVKNWEGAAGSLTIDENGDPQFEYAVKTIKNGKIVPLAE